MGSIENDRWRIVNSPIDMFLEPDAGRWLLDSVNWLSLCYRFLVWLIRVDFWKLASSTSFTS